MINLEGGNVLSSSMHMAIRLKITHLNFLIVKFLQQTMGIRVCDALFMYLSIFYCGFIVLVIQHRKIVQQIPFSCGSSFSIFLSKIIFKLISKFTCRLHGEQ